MYTYMGPRGGPGTCTSPRPPSPRAAVQKSVRFELFELFERFELFELLLKLDKQFPVERFEATAPQSTVPPPLSLILRLRDKS